MKLYVSLITVDFLFVNLAYNSLPAAPLSGLAEFIVAFRFHFR
jgi:hypothetical protein